MLYAMLFRLLQLACGYLLHQFSDRNAAFQKAKAILLRLFSHVKTFHLSGGKSRIQHKFQGKGVVHYDHPIELAYCNS